MNIEEALYSHLTNDAGVSALVGNRVYPLMAPQDAALPHLVYQRISSPRLRSHGGPSGLAHPRFQITATAGSYSAARSLANAVRASLDGFRGTMGGGVSVGASFLDNEADGYQDVADTYTVRLDVILWHQEA